VDYQPGLPDSPAGGDTTRFGTSCTPQGTSNTHLYMDIGGRTLHALRWCGFGCKRGADCRHQRDSDCAHRKSPGVLTEIPHLMAGSVYLLAGAGGGSAEGVCGGVVVA
jgi:hypothetical protein